MSLIADYGLVLLLLACLFGFFMAWGVGANDVANAMGTSVGSRALTIKQAILIAMVFEFAGAYLAGGQVTETIKSGIVDASMITPDLMVLGMMSALLAAGTWLLIASTRGWPVSTTHSIVGAVIGFAAVGVSMDAVNWAGVGPIVARRGISPVVSGGVAFGLFVSVQRLIIDTDEPFLNAKRFVPLYMFATGFMVSIMTLTKGLKHFGLIVSVQRLIIDTDEPFLNAKRFVPLYMFATGFMVSIMTLTKGLKHIGLNLSSTEGFMLSL